MLNAQIRARDAAVRGSADAVRDRVEGAGVDAGWLEGTKLVQASTTSGPDISVNETTLAFGSVSTGGEGTLNLVISNDGDADLSVSSSVISGANAAEFEISSGSTTAQIAPGGSHTLIVSFKPTTEGSKSATLSIASDDANQPSVEVALSGTGAAAAVGLLPPSAWRMKLETTRPSSGSMRGP